MVKSSFEKLDNRYWKIIKILEASIQSVFAKLEISLLFQETSFLYNNEGRDSINVPGDHTLYIQVLQLSLDPEPFSGCFILVMKSPEGSNLPSILCP